MRLERGHSEVVRRGDKVYKPIVGHEIEILKRLPVDLDDVVEFVSVEDGYIVMQYIPGLILNNDLVQSLDWRPIFRRLLLTIIKLNAAGIVHGDISFGNLILSRSKLILIDFGTSLYLEEEEKLTHFFNQTMAIS